MNLSGLRTVRYEKRGRVAHVCLDRPALLNAMNLEMHSELCGVWDDFEADDDIWLAILSGAGDRAFSVGQDLKETASRLRDGAAETSSFGSREGAGWPRLTERFAVSKPIVAKVRGFALGGGFELALACDIIVAAETAVFGLPEARLGLVPGAGGVFRLMRQLPQRSALGYLLTGRRIPAARAWELGLVNEVVPDDGLDAAVGQWADDILACGPLSVRAIKEAAHASASLPLEEAFSRRYHWEERRMRSHDACEGPLAFVEKRKPQWRGV